MASDTFYFERDAERRGDSRAHVEVHKEGLLLRCDDDHYDGEMAPEEALQLARAILAKYAG